jgi:hypothetical protein
VTPPRPRPTPPPVPRPRPTPPPVPPPNRTLAEIEEARDNGRILVEQFSKSIDSLPSSLSEFLRKETIKQPTYILELTSLNVCSFAYRQDNDHQSRSSSVCNSYNDWRNWSERLQ